MLLSIVMATGISRRPPLLFYRLMSVYMTPSKYKETGMGWRDWFTMGKKIADEVTEAVDEGKELLEKANSTLQESLNAAELEVVKLKQTGAEALETAEGKVKEMETKLDVAIAPDFVEVKPKEFEQLIKGSTAKKTGEQSKPKKVAPIVTHYYNNGLIVGMAVRWPQKKFFYRAEYTWPKL